MDNGNLGLTDELKAVHESGHSIVSYLFGRKTVFISINPDEINGYKTRARTAYGDHPAPDPFGNPLFFHWSYLTIKLAGPIAHFLRWPVMDGYPMDYIKVISHLRIFLPRAERLEWARYGFLSAFALVTNPVISTAIDEFASIILKYREINFIENNNGTKEAKQIFNRINRQSPAPIKRMKNAAFKSLSQAGYYDQMIIDESAGFGRSDDQNDYDLWTGTYSRENLICKQGLLELLQNIDESELVRVFPLFQKLVEDSRWDCDYIRDSAFVIDGLSTIIDDLSNILTVTPKDSL